MFGIFKKAPKTKVCCNCGITYVVNHKSYWSGFNGTHGLSFCSKRCMFESEDRYNDLKKRFDKNTAISYMFEYIKRQSGTYEKLKTKQTT